MEVQLERAGQFGVVQLGTAHGPVEEVQLAARQTGSTAALVPDQLVAVSLTLSLIPSAAYASFPSPADGSVQLRQLGAFPFVAGTA
ncbi:hypothetical protein [Streptomyces canus]|uniref:hypothetical protein n=1 Tax=Streptomyces canus TaxID=58343 RepID=UPI002E2D88DA|nr:hypothetical protein [Streptomyces canus]